MRRSIHIHIHTHDAQPSRSALIDDLVERMWRCLQDFKARTHDAWAEAKHPRATDGRFGKKAGEHESDASAVLKGKSGLRTLLTSGTPMTAKQLMDALGLDKEVTLNTYLADLRNPKYAGKEGALNIVKGADGTYIVASGAPAPAVERKPKTETPAPPAPPVSVTPPPSPASSNARIEQVKADLKAKLAEDDKLYQFNYPIAAVAHPDGSGTLVVNSPGRLFGDGERARVLELAIAQGLKEQPQTYESRSRMIVFTLPAKDVKLDAPETWVPAKTAKEASARAVSEGYLDAADFGKMPAESANALMASVHEHMKEFPALRRQGHMFVGTNAGWKREAVRKQTEVWAGLLKATHPDMSDEALARNLKYRVTAPRQSSKNWATAWRMGTAPGQKDMRAVAINETFAAGGEDTARELRRNAEQNWHPPRCDTIKSVMDHELGHQMDYMLGLRSLPEMQELYAKAKLAPHGVAGAVSRYASTNIAEFIAESWAEYKNNPTPRKMAAEVGDLIRKAYARKYNQA